MKQLIKSFMVLFVCLLTSSTTAHANSVVLEQNYYTPEVVGLSPVKYLAANGNDVVQDIQYLRGSFYGSYFNVHYLQDPIPLDRVPTNQSDLPSYLNMDLIVSILSVSELVSPTNLAKEIGITLTADEYAVATQLALSKAVATNSQVYKIEESSISHAGLNTASDWILKKAQEQIKLKPTNTSTLDYLWGTPSMNLDASGVSSVVEGNFNYYGPYYIKSNDLTLEVTPAVSPTNYALVNGIGGSVISKFSVNDPFYIRFDNQLITDINIVFEASPRLAALVTYGDHVGLYRGLTKLQVPLVIGNQTRAGIVTYLKYDSNTRTVIPGVVLEIRDTAGTVVGTMTTDNTGVATSPELQVGEYIVVEKNTVSGYILDATEYPVSIIGNGTLVELTSTGVSSNAISNFSVYDVSTSAPVVGSVFEIVDEVTNTVIKKIGIGASGVCNNIALPAGNYFLREVVTDNTYQLLTTHTRFELVSGKETNIVLHKEKAYNTTVFRFEDTDGNVLKDVNFSLFDSTGGFIISLSATGGEFSVPLPRGDYYIVPSGMHTGVSVSFTVDSSNQDKYVAVLISLDNGSIIGTVFDEFGDGLSNVTLSVVSDDGVSFSQTTTGLDGRYVLGNVPTGSVVYVMVTNAPVGYSGETTYNKLLLLGELVECDLILRDLESVNAELGIALDTPYPFYTTGQMTFTGLTYYVQTPFSIDLFIEKPLILEEDIPSVADSVLTDVSTDPEIDLQSISLIGIAAVGFVICVILFRAKKKGS